MFASEKFCSRIFAEGYKLIRFVAECFKRTELKNIKKNELKEPSYECTVFINEIGCNFNLRKPKSKKPTNIYFVARVKNKQIKLSTSVRVYPDQWNVKKQEAYISCRLTELDNENNTIVNEKIGKLKLYFRNTSDIFATTLKR